VVSLWENSPFVIYSLGYFLVFLFLFVFVLVALLLLYLYCFIFDASIPFFSSSIFFSFFSLFLFFFFLFFLLLFFVLLLVLFRLRLLLFLLFLLYLLLADAHATPAQVYMAASPLTSMGAASAPEASLAYGSSVTGKTAGNLTARGVHH